jgi:hypothetical protein
MQSPTVFQNQMSLRVFDTQLGAQGMESICELRHCLALLLPQCGPSHVLVFIVINRVVLFLDRIHKKIPSGLDPIYSRFLCGTFLPVSFPPMFDMGESLEECEGDLFPVGKKCEQRNNLLADLTIFLRHPHLSDLQIWEYQN